MSDKTFIEWADATWNPIVGCSKCSPGCANCYAERMAMRLAAMGQEQYSAVTDENGWNGTTALCEKQLGKPMAWKKPRRIFVCSMGDLFHPNNNPQWINIVLRTFICESHHTYLVLTKRPDIAMRFMQAWYAYTNIAASLPNIWIGTTVCTQEEADSKIPQLLEIPAAVRFVSVEPMLEQIDLTKYYFAAKNNGVYPFPYLAHEDRTKWIHLLDQVICGGESGPGARPLHPDWVRSLRDQCVAAKTPFLFKQWGEWKSVYDRDKDDPDWRKCPKRTKIERILNLAGGHGFHGERVCGVRKVGKKKAGRLLDGQLWDQYPPTAQEAPHA